MGNLLQPKHYARIREVQAMDEPTWYIEKWLRAREGWINKSQIMGRFQRFSHTERERVLKALELQGKIMRKEEKQEGKKNAVFYQYIH